MMDNVGDVNERDERNKTIEPNEQTTARHDKAMAAKQRQQ